MTNEKEVKEKYIHYDLTNGKEIIGIPVIVDDTSGTIGLKNSCQLTYRPDGQLATVPYPFTRKPDDVVTINSRNIVAVSVFPEELIAPPKKKTLMELH